MHNLATEIYTPFLQLKKTAMVPRRLVTMKQNTNWSSEKIRLSLDTNVKKIPC